MSPLFNPPLAGGGTPAVTDEGAPLTQRATIDFTGEGVTAADDAANTRTRVTIPGLSRFHSQRCYTAPGVRTTDQFSANGAGIYAPFWVGRTQSFDAVAVDVTVAGSAGSVVRLGVYKDDGTGWPGTLVVDAGTVDTATTGLKSITAGLGALTDLAPDLFWLFAASQGGATTQPTLRAVGNGSHQWVGVIPPGSASHTVYNVSGVTGTLASPAATPAGSLGTGVTVFIRAT